MKKLVYFFNGRLPTEKAHGVQIAKMCEVFAAQRLSVELVLPYRHNKIKQDIFSYYSLKKNFSVINLWSLDTMRLSFIPKRLSFFIQSITSAISMTFYLWSRPYAKDTIYYARDYTSLFTLGLLGRRPVGELHDYRLKKPRSFAKFIFEHLRALIVNSAGTLNAIRQHYQISDERVLVASNAADTDFFDIMESKSEARSVLGLPADDFIVSYIGQLETVGMEKGVSNLMKAFAELLKTKNNCTLCVIGGPDHRISEYKQEAKNLDLPENKIIFTGQVMYKQIPLYLRAIDVVTIPFPRNKQFEQTASPLKVFEFMAAGKTIVASDLPTLRTVLNDKNCLFVEPENVHQLGEALLGLFESPELRDSLAKQAKDDSWQHSLSTRAKNILNFIKDV